MSEFSALTPLESLIEVGITGLKHPQSHGYDCKTGFEVIDRMSSWNTGQLVCIGARPGMGKTAFMLDLALNFSEEHQVIFHSTELNLRQLFMRIASKTCEVDGLMARRELENFEMSNLKEKLGEISDRWLDFLEGYPSKSENYFDEIRERLKDEHCSVLMLDCADLIGYSVLDAGRAKQWELLEGLKRLKTFCERRAILLVVSTQLDRELEYRMDKRPMLSDLVLPGLEWVSDHVGFLYRPEYYGITQDHEGNDLTGLAEFILRKTRSGSTGAAPVLFIAKYGRFEEYDINNFIAEEATFDEFKKDLKDKAEDLKERSEKFDMGDAPF